VTTWVLLFYCQYSTVSYYELQRKKIWMLCDYFTVPNYSRFGKYGHSMKTGRYWRKKKKNCWLVELKVKLALSKPWMRGGAEVYLCLFLTPAVGRVEWWASSSGCFPPVCTHWNCGLMNGLVDRKKLKNREGRKKGWMKDSWRSR
jgi:hypothetical protein